MRSTDHRVKDLGLIFLFQIKENKPELEEPDPEEADPMKDSESSASKLNGKKKNFLMIHVTIAQIFLMLHVMKHKNI